MSWFSVDPEDPKSHTFGFEFFFGFLEDREHFATRWVPAADHEEHVARFQIGRRENHLITFSDHADWERSFGKAAKSRFHAQHRLGRFFDRNSLDELLHSIVVLQGGETFGVLQPFDIGESKSLGGLKGMKGFVSMVRFGKDGRLNEEDILAKVSFARGVDNISRRCKFLQQVASFDQYQAAGFDVGIEVAKASGVLGHRALKKDARLRLPEFDRIVRVFRQTKSIIAATIATASSSIGPSKIVASDGKDQQCNQEISSHSAMPGATRPLRRRPSSIGG